MTAADRIVLLEVHYDIRIVLTPDGRQLDVDGPSLAVQAAEPMLLRYRNALVAQLRIQASTPVPVDGLVHDTSSRRRPEPSATNLALQGISSVTSEEE